MRFFLTVGFLFFASWDCSSCLGHGFPIRVDTHEGRLVVSGGLSDTRGYASYIFDHHEDAYLDLLPGFKLGSTLPGFEVYGMEIGSQLSMEVVSRPDFTQDGNPERWLWHWSAASGQVEIAPADPTLEIVSQQLFGSVELTQLSAPTTGPTVKVMEPLASDLGSHQHPFLYRLENSPVAPIGVYGFFARVTSPNYESSDPFLVALNNGLSATEFLSGARLLNAAARLPGDYEFDDSVNGIDFLIWQRTLGSTTQLAADGSLNGIVDAQDLQVWQANYGEEVTAAIVANVPEPASFSVAVLGLLLSTCRRCCGRASSARRRR